GYLGQGSLDELFYEITDGWAGQEHHGGIRPFQLASNIVDEIAHRLRRQVKDAVILAMIYGRFDKLFRSGLHLVNRNLVLLTYIRLDNRPADRLANILSQ